MVGVRTNFGPGGNANTRHDVNAMEGPGVGDFYADLKKMRGFVQPQQRPRGPSASDQAMALRTPQAVPDRLTGDTGANMSFVKQVGGANQVSGAVRGYAGDPGAVYGGYIPGGAVQPGQAQFVRTEQPERGFGDFEDYAGREAGRADYTAAKNTGQDPSSAAQRYWLMRAEMGRGAGA